MTTVFYDADRAEYRRSQSVAEQYAHTVGITREYDESDDALMMRAYKIMYDGPARTVEEPKPEVVDRFSALGIDE